MRYRVGVDIGGTFTDVVLLRAEGRDVLELFGAPYWLPAAHVLEAAAVAVYDPHSAHSQGLPALREAVGARGRDRGIAVDPEREVLVTNAAMHALHLAFGGDETVVHEAGRRIRAAWADLARGQGGA